VKFEIHPEQKIKLLLRSIFIQCTIKRSLQRNSSNAVTSNTDRTFTYDRKNISTHLSILFVTTSTLFSFFFSDIPFISEMKITLKPVSVRMLTIACYFIFLARLLPLVHPFSRNYQHSHLVDDVRFTKLSAKKVKKSKQRNTIGEF